MRARLKQAGRIVTVVIHDPRVKRAFWQFCVLIAVRVAIAAGASVELVQLLQKLGG